MGNVLKLILAGFKWVEETSQFNIDFIKSYNEDSDREHFIEADIQYSEKGHEFHNESAFLHKRTACSQLA